MNIEENQTLAKWIGIHAKQRPDVAAITIANQVTNYGELYERVARTCSGLADIGIKKGDVVGVQLPNCLEFVVASLAIATRGAIMQTLHMPCRTNELRGLLVDSNAKAVIVTNAEKDSRANDVISIRGDLSGLKEVVVVGGAMTGTAGGAVSKTDIRVVDDSEKILDADTDGSLQVRGPSVFDGYLNRPDENTAAFTTDGWFRTSDLATIDRQGYLSITGRVKELINRGGVKFNPAEVEEVLNCHPAIESCAIIPVSDVELGERGCLCVRLNDQHDLTLEDVKTALVEFGMAGE